MTTGRDVSPMTNPIRLLLLLLVLVGVLAVQGCLDNRNVAEPANWHRTPGGVGVAQPAVSLPRPESLEAGWYRPRSSWSVQPVFVARATLMIGVPNRITVHHSNFPDDTNPDAAEVLRRIEAAHCRGIGQSGPPGACIAYHFLIAPNGTVYEGRPLKYQGAHAGGQNNVQNIGVCLLGNFEDHPGPAAQVRSLIQVLDRLRSTYRIPRTKVLGHLDFNPPGNHHTDCPGVYLYRIVKAYRSGP